MEGFENILNKQLQYYSDIDQVLQNELNFKSKFEENFSQQEMEEINKKININCKLVKDLPDDAVELARFLASCNTFFKILNPIGGSFQFLEAKTQEFEEALKNHYMRKISCYNFYLSMFTLKQKSNENVHSFVTRLTNKKNKFLQQNQPGDLKLDEIMTKALIAGLEPRLRLYAQLKSEQDFDVLVKNLEEVESTMSTQSAIDEVNVASILLNAVRDPVENAIPQALAQAQALPIIQEVNYHQQQFQPRTLRHYAPPNFQENQGQFVSNKSYRKNSNYYSPKKNQNSGNQNSSN